MRGAADTTWYELPASRTLTLSQLPAGDYTLRLRAESSSGLQAANELALTVHVAHTWWKSRPLWAVLLTLLAGGLGSYLWLARRRTQRDRVELRRRLTHELDTLLAHASRQAEYIQSQYPVATPTATPLLEDLRTATQAMRDLAWGLAPAPTPSATYLTACANTRPAWLRPLRCRWRCEPKTCAKASRFPPSSAGMCMLSTRRRWPIRYATPATAPHCACASWAGS